MDTKNQKHIEKYYKKLKKVFEKYAFELYELSSIIKNSEFQEFSQYYEIIASINEAYFSNPESINRRLIPNLVFNTRLGTKIEVDFNPHIVWAYKIDDKIWI